MTDEERRTPQNPNGTEMPPLEVEEDILDLEKAHPADAADHLENLPLPEQVQVIRNTRTQQLFFREQHRAISFR